MAFILLGSVLFFLHEISLNFLWLSFATNIIEVFMVIVWVAIFFTVIFSIVFLTLKYIYDSKINKLAMRRVRPR